MGLGMVYLCELRQTGSSWEDGCAGPCTHLVIRRLQSSAKLIYFCRIWTGVAVFIGAGGPMGQMHVQRAIELADGPRTIIATEVSDDRLNALHNRFADLAAQHGRTLLLFNPKASALSLYSLVMQATAGRGAEKALIEAFWQPPTP